VLGGVDVEANLPTTLRRDVNGGEPTAQEVAGTDTTGWGYSLANLGELLFGCLDAIEAKSVLEIGGYKGELTSELLDWADRSGARVTSLDPEPPDELLELGRQRPELELLVQTSHDALREVEFPDAIIVDGDHNYFTLSEELRIVGERAPGAEIPLMMFHDVGWPHARRDTYYVPERIPEEHRQPLAHEVYLSPSEPGVSEDGGLPYVWAAEREGGPANGTLTALEDFVAAHEGLRLATVPAFFGFGVLWHTGAPWADAVAELIRPWDRNPMLERLEANRVSQIVERSRDLVRAQKVNEELEARSRGQGDRLREKEQELHERAAKMRELDAKMRRQQTQLNAQRGLLQRMAESRALAIAERLSRLRRGGKPAFTREEVRRVLRGDEASASSR
jgi:hypothetical protein